MSGAQIVHTGCIAIQSFMAAVTAFHGYWPLPVICIAGALLSIAGLVFS